MTKDEIKEKYSMADILAGYGMHPSRAGMIHCPFHHGDREPSMKIYKKDFHCFGCGTSGDVFTFVQKMDGLGFKEAFELLGGTYEHAGPEAYKAQMAAYRARKKRETRERTELRTKMQKKENSDMITLYRLFLAVLAPVSDLWCDIYNKLQYQIYIHDILNDLR